MMSDSSTPYDFKKILANRDLPLLRSHSRSPQGIIVFHAILPSITLVLLLVRNYSRFFFIQVKGWDDVLLNLAWVCTAILGAFICLSTKHGIGMHVPDVSPMDRAELLKIMWWGQVLYLCANCFIKNAFFVFYLRLASHQGRYAIITKTFIVVNTCMFISCTITAFFICQPVSYFWTKALNVGGGTCHSIRAFYLANACLNMLMDLATLILPIPIIFGSPTLSLAKKLKISSLFLLGAVTCFASIMRIPTLVTVTKIGGDFTYHVLRSSDWTVSELNIAILVACIPAIKPLVCSLLGKPTSIAGNSYSPHSLPNSNQRSTSKSPMPSGVMVDSWELRDHRGDVRASISVPGKGLAVKGDHILLEDTFTVDITREELDESGHVREVREDGRWSENSQENIVPNEAESARRTRR